MIGRRGAASRPSYQALPRRVRRRLMAFSLLRALGSATVLVGLYYGLPLDRSGGVAVSVGLVVGLLVFVAVVIVQVWQIMRSDYPRLRAVEAIASAIPLFLLVFAATYYLLSGGRPGAFSEPLDRTDALYFTVTVFSTVGFGDITPVTQPARVVAMVQMLADLAVIGVVARVIVGAVGAGLRRRTATADARDTEPGGGHEPGGSPGATIPTG
jgi:voltage-gated potassium channel